MHQTLFCPNSRNLPPSPPPHTHTLNFFCILVPDQERGSEAGAVLQDGGRVFCPVHPRGPALMAGARDQMSADPLAAGLRPAARHESGRRVSVISTVSHSL